MSEHTAIRDVTMQLRWLLFEGLSSTNLGNHHVDPHSISPFSPVDIVAGNEQGLLSLFLFQIVPSAAVRNEPSEAGSSAHVDLLYLMTPTSGEPDTDMLILGRVIQILEAHADLRSSSRMPNLSVTPVEAHITQHALSLEESARLWDAFGQPYQLSVCYRVAGVSIDAR